MGAVVVYESSFGNTALVARAIAAGIVEHMHVTVLPVDEVKPVCDGRDTLVVVGGPTHEAGMSRPQTRHVAQERQHRPPVETTGIREWIQELPDDDPPRVVYATFDTRVVSSRELPGSAARSAHHALRGRGHETVAEPESFYVAHVTGPLLPDEETRAREWGEQLARDLC
jgi:hypothetical protein